MMRCFRGVWETAICGSVSKDPCKGVDLIPGMSETGDLQLIAT